MRGVLDGKERVVISIFTRRALVVLASQEKLSRVREALSAAGIRSAVQIRGGAGRGARPQRDLRRSAGRAVSVYGLCAPKRL